MAKIITTGSDLDILLPPQLRTNLPIIDKNVSDWGFNGSTYNVVKMYSVMYFLFNAIAGRNKMRNAILAGVATASGDSETRFLMVREGWMMTPKSQLTPKIFGGWLLNHNLFDNYAGPKNTLGNIPSVKDPNKWTKDDDFFKYRGGFFIQVTGAYNYEIAHHDLKILYSKVGGTSPVIKSILNQDFRSIKCNQWDILTSDPLCSTIAAASFIYRAYRRKVDQAEGAVSSIQSIAQPIFKAIGYSNTTNSVGTPGIPEFIKRVETINKLVINYLK